MSRQAFRPQVSSYSAIYMLAQQHSTPLTALPKSSSLMLPSPPSEMEAKFYYAGLPSKPVLVARTGPPWKAPTGPEAYLQPKELRAVGNHMLEEVWEDNLALKLHSLLDSMKVKWTSTDVVRMWNTVESSSSIVLWIGVMPTSLTGDDGVVVVFKCLDLLRQHDIADVEVEIRDSVVTRLGGPKFLPSNSLSTSSTIDVRNPLTTTLGLPICSQSTPWAEGSGSFFITEEGKPERLLLVTARHVLFKADKNDNELIECKNNSQHNVMLFGDRAFERYLKSIKVEIEDNKDTIIKLETCLVAVQERDDPAANKQRAILQPQLDSARAAEEELKTFHQEVLTSWGPPESRVIGHVILSPPLKPGFGDEGYTEDWAIIEIDASKVDASNFQGNAIDLGKDISSSAFIRMMPLPKNAETFRYPYKDRLLRVYGTIPDEDVRKPTALDENDEPCLMVVKCGSVTGVTIGRSNNIVSYDREYYEDETYETSKGWSIFSHGVKSGVFSEHGDSGSVIVDGLGRIGGLLTGGCLDITYATPISFLLKRMRENGLEPNVNPTLNPPVEITSEQNLSNS